MVHVYQVLGRLGFALFLLVVLFVAQLAFVLILDRKKETDIEVWYACVLVLLLVPEIIHIITTVWAASFLAERKSLEWPLFRGIFAGILLCVIEAGSISLLTFQVLPNIPGFMVLPLLNVSLLPELAYTVKNFGYKYAKDCIEPTVRIVFCVATVLAVIIVSIFLRNCDILMYYQAAIFPFLLVGSSFSLYAPIKRHIYGESAGSVHNTSILYGSFRIVTYVLSCLMIFNCEKNDTLSLDFQHLINGFNSFHDFISLHRLIAIHVSLSVMSQIVKIVPKHSSFTTFVPNFLTPIVVAVTYILLSIYGPSGLDLLNVSVHEIHMNNTYVVIYCMTFVLMVVPLGSMFLPLCFRHLKVVEYSSKNSFNVPTHRYSSVLLLQYMLITKEVFRTQMTEINEKIIKPTRVYICTTMYQEAEHEMERLLKSLNSVISSEKLRQAKISLESHIFLDNGADGKDMKDFGKQLLAIAEDVIRLRPDSGLMLYTPYGIQLHWVLECGTPLFIHLKDVKKVKAKKRWSQVMYLEYILNFRSKRNYFQSSKSASTESLDRLSDYYSSNEINNTDKTSSKYSYGNFLDVPDVVLYQSDSGAEDDTSFTIDMASNDGSIYPADNKSRTGSDLVVKETPTEIHTKENTVFSVSLSMSNINSGINQEETNDYILMTDADMAFDADAVLDVVNVCNDNPDVGGICGRTYPIGVHRHPIIWLQMFEFAKDFWMVKSSQNVIGSVMCCPGCFSLFRFEALNDVFETYAGSTETVLDVFTKDNGEDRWMCTLMMLKGWKLRYSHEGKNSTYCPETTMEFMKQRRRWLLSDYTNALVVAQNLANLITKNTAFSLIYTLYFLQLFLIMVLYPGATIMMLCLSLNLTTDIPLLAITPTFSLVVVVYCVALVSRLSSSVQLIVTKLLIVLLGLMTLYIFGSTGVIIIQGLVEDYKSHIEYIMLLGLAATFPFAALLHPSELALLICGLPYMFFIPFMNIILPMYAICNIVDQTWGTRDNQIAKVPKFLSLPKLKKRKKKKKTKLLSSRSGSYTSLNSSVLDLQNFNEDEMTFWEKVVENHVGINVKVGMTSDDRTHGLRIMRNKVVIGFLVINGLWIAVLCVCYGYFLHLMGNKKLIFSIVILSSLGLTPLIQMAGMIVDRLSILFKKMRQIL